MTGEQLRKWVNEQQAVEDDMESGDPPLLLADGFDDAIVGIAQQFRDPSVVVYDKEKCLRILMERDGMDREGAEEFFDFNVQGAYVGERTPMYLQVPEEAR